MRRLAVAVALLVLATVPAAAQQAVVKIGFVVDITGPASSLGVPERNTLQLYQDDLGTAKGPNGDVRVQNGTWTLVRQ